MIAFEQYNFPFNFTKLAWLANDVLCFQYRGITKKIEKRIPLPYMYPEVKCLAHKSITAGFLTFLGIALMFIIAVDYSSNPASWENIWNFISAELPPFIMAIFSCWCFWRSSRKRMVFYFKNGEVAFELLYHENANSFKDEFIKKSIRAALIEDNKNMALLKSEISQLTKNQIINQEFEDILCGRLLHIPNFDFKL